MRRENIDAVLLTRRGLCTLVVGAGLGALAGCGSASGKDGDAAQPAAGDVPAAPQAPAASDGEMAAEPVAVARAPAPPSRAAMRCSKTELVGFINRV